MSGLPTKLTKDAIAEAICEVRFECEESASIPEIVVGKLAEFSMWKDFPKTRLPASDIPFPVRASDPNLKNEPILQFTSPSRDRLAKIGSNVLSFNRLAPYPGWLVFKSEIDQFLDFLFSSFSEFKVRRLGFRYVNIFNEEDHGVVGVRSLNFSVTVAGEKLGEALNLNYQRIHSNEHIVRIRVASPDFVLSSKRVHALVDLDVFTPKNVVISNNDSAHEWIEQAHNYEKEEFFNLFTEDMKKKLVEAQ